MEKKKISAFYREACEKRAAFERAFFADNRNTAFKQALNDTVKKLSDGAGMDALLSHAEETINLTYRSDWFEFPWMMEQAKNDDLFKIRRLLDYLSKEGFSMIRHHVPTNTIIGDSVMLEGMADLICKKDDTVYAVLICDKKTDRSLKGRGLHTNVSTDLHCLTAKEYLERWYPGIHIMRIYLSSSEEEAGKLLPALEKGTSKKHHVFDLDYGTYYHDGVFDRLSFHNLIDEVFRTPLSKDCFFCPYSSLCHLEESDKNGKEDLVQQSYILPSFTKEQLQIVSHTDGPMRVCAGPGSGKTAVLVGRIKNLIDHGTDPEFILCITFAREAANELIHRVKSFCSDDCMPKICTLNALGYEILRDNADIVGKKTFFSDGARMDLIKSLLSCREPLSGFNYGILTGHTGLLKTVAKRIDEYQKSPETFFEKNPHIGSDFISFYDEYMEVVKQAGYISFDDQILLANKLLEEHPERAQIYQNLYQYVMVDEYQDIDAQQAKLCDIIAKHGNLVVVGDDDQSIYKFRGGENKYLIHFEERYPECRTVILTHNFRSTKDIVSQANKLICQNTNRLDKKIVCEKEGIPPETVAGSDSASISKCIERLLANGYSFGDIAILARNNKTLESLHEELPYPTVLAKRYLRNEPLFLILLSVMRLIDTEGKDHCAEFILSQSAGIKDESVLRQKLETVLRAASNQTPSSFVDLVSEVFEAGTDETIDCLLDQIERQKVYDMKSMLNFLSYIYDYDDPIKVSVNQQNRILLITDHESKGREYKAVILVNPASDRSDSDEEESRRVIYVAMTRAMERLFVCS